MAERDIQNRILLECGRGDTRLFRNATAHAYVGKGERVPQPRMVRMEPGDVLIRKAREIQAGLCEGSPDLIGWRSVEITLDMVGQRVAVFAGLEVKTDTGRASPEQTRFIAAVRDAGGIAGIVRSPESAAALLAGEAVDK